jgi:hypothetical protein
MQWYPLTNRDSGLLLGIFIFSGIFNVIQPYFIPVEIRPFTYALVVFLLLTGFFFRVKPEHPMELGKFLAVLLGAIVVGIIVLRDVLIRQNFSLAPAIFLAGAILYPLIAGCIYALARKYLPHT